jgi:hypothetical protein
MMAESQSPTRRDFYRDHPKLTYVPLEELARPRNGVWQVYVDYWWTVDPERGAIIFDKWFPQCNEAERITRRVTEQLYPWAEARQIPVAYTRYDTRERY